MSFNTIINPINRNRHSIFSKEGRNILKDYLKTYKLGGREPTAAFKSGLTIDTSFNNTLKDAMSSEKEKDIEIEIVPSNEDETDLSPLASSRVPKYKNFRPSLSFFTDEVSVDNKSDKFDAEKDDRRIWVNNSLDLKNNVCNNLKGNTVKKCSYIQKTVDKKKSAILNLKCDKDISPTNKSEISKCIKESFKSVKDKLNEGYNDDDEKNGADYVEFGNYYYNKNGWSNIADIVVNDKKNEGQQDEWLTKVNINSDETYNVKFVEDVDNNNAKTLRDLWDKLQEEEAEYNDNDNEGDSVITELEALEIQLLYIINKLGNLNYCHNDIHWDNVLVKKLNKPTEITLTFNIGDIYKEFDENNEIIDSKIKDSKIKDNEKIIIKTRYKPVVIDWDFFSKEYVETSNIKGIIAINDIYSNILDGKTTFRNFKYSDVIVYLMKLFFINDISKVGKSKMLYYALRYKMLPIPKDVNESDIKSKETIQKYWEGVLNEE